MVDPGALDAANGTIDLDADEAVCPACQETFATTERACPSCGLRFG